jgi:hypothetical protein
LYFLTFYCIVVFMNYTAYGSVEGHHAFFETTDRSLAIDVACRLTGKLAMRGECLPEGFFEEHIGNRALGTARPGMGDFGVNVAVDGRYAQLETDGQPVYTVIGATFNVRDTDPTGGAERLQSAFVAAIDGALENVGENIGV